MKNRHPLAVFILPYITFGLYSIVWLVSTKKELNELVGTSIPTAWLLLIPGANIYWLWKYCEAIEELTYGDKAAIGTFVLFLIPTLFCLGPLAMAIMQNTYNKHYDELEDVVRVRIGTV